MKSSTAAPSFKNSGFDTTSKSIGQVLADRARNREHVRQVGRAVLVRRRAHRDELEQAVRHAGCEVRSEFQAPGLPAVGDDPIEARLVDRYLAGLEPLDFVRVDVDA
jgi:hypothetical protein